MPKQSESIDPAIKPLVDSLNAIRGVKTIASCQGHANGNRPYVYFYAPVEVAARIEKRLRTASMYDEKGLNTLWDVKASFDADYRLCFVLEAPKYSARAVSSLLWPILFLQVFRDKIDAEIVVLSHLVEDAMISA